VVSQEAQIVPFAIIKIKPNVVDSLCKRWIEKS
jgi:hypothetical protein